jgi:hypothetical protein
MSELIGTFTLGPCWIEGCLPNLRWRRGETPGGVVLQQAWHMVRGGESKIEWRDVPTVDEGKP